MKTNFERNYEENKPLRGENTKQPVSPLELISVTNGKASMQDKNWLEGRADGLRYVDQQLLNLVDVFTAGDQDFELALLKTVDDVRKDLHLTENAIEEGNYEGNADART